MGPKKSRQDILVRFGGDLPSGYLSYIAKPCTIFIDHKNDDLPIQKGHDFT